MIDSFNFLVKATQNERKSSNFATVIIQISEQQIIGRSGDGFLICVVHGAKKQHL